jgi:hypothetical protein
MRRSALVVVGLGLLAVTGCGTTVPLSSQVTSTDGVVPGGESATTGGGGLGAATGGTGTATTGASIAGSSTGALVPAGPSAAGTTDVSATGDTGTGPSAGTVGGKLAPVRIGFTTVPDAAAFAATFGVQSTNVDQAGMFRNVVAWVNKKGGLNGHPIDAKIEAVSATSQETYDSQYQKLCARYTQDLKVIAASNIGVGADTNMDSCMSRAKTLFLTGSNTLHTEQSYVATPYVVSPYEPTATVVAKTFADLVVSRGFEKRGGKVGILQYDIPEYQLAVDKVLKPILAKAGIGLIRYTIPPPASTAEIGNSVAVVQSAQLRMASEGVKTVTFLCSGCAVFFIQSAQSQAYYPRYVLSSMDSPGAADGASYEQSLRSSVSIGWNPVFDYGSTVPPAPPAYSSTYHQCYTIQKQAFDLSTLEARQTAMLTCDAVLQFYYAAKANPTETITSESLRDGMLKLGTSHPSALGFATDLRPNKHAGAAQYRLMTWNDVCSCPAYSGSALAFPSL